jgi:hypothetical protein
VILFVGAYLILQLERLPSNALSYLLANALGSIDGRRACYTFMMAKKRSVENKIDKLTKLVETIAEDVVGIDERLASLATRDQTQVNAVETDIRSIKNAKLETRVADLEDKVFGETRA